MPAIPYWRLAGFYFFYFAYLGAFAPYFSLYLAAAGLDAVQIGVLMSLPQVARIVAPNLWGWLSDRTGERLAIARWTGVVGTVAFAGVFAGRGFEWLFAVLLTMSFFWSAALPLVDVTTLNHLRDAIARYGRIRLWGSIGFIGGVVIVGAVLDRVAIAALLPIVFVTMLGMLVFTWVVPDAEVRPAAHDHLPIRAILARPEVVALIVACALMAMAHGAYYTFYSIYLVDHGYSKAAVGWLWAVGVVCEIGVFILMPRLFRAFSLEGLLITSFALATLRFVLIGWGVESLVVLVFAQTLHAASFGSFHASAMARVQRFFGGRHQAGGQAIYGSLSFGLGGTLGALGAGVAWEVLGPTWTFTASSAAAAVGGILLLVWLRPGARRLAT
jgi:PPP family 3-phenylpropionic acid transporter